MKGTEKLSVLQGSHSLEFRSCQEDLVEVFNPVFGRTKLVQNRKNKPTNEKTIKEKGKKKNWWHSAGFEHASSRFNRFSSLAPGPMY